MTKARGKRIRCLINFFNCDRICMTFYDDDLISVVYFILVNFVTASEERYHLGRYGDKYLRVPERTPKWMRISGLRRKKMG